MPNVRRHGQKLIPIPMDQRFIDEIDRAYQQIGHNDRSSFIREAIREKLAREGFIVAREITLAPKRTKKREEANPDPTSSVVEVIGSIVPVKRKKKKP